MERDYIVLRYARSDELVNDEHPLNGTITVSVAGLILEEQEFKDLTFLRMIILLAFVMNEHMEHYPELRVFFGRLEHPKKLVVELEPSTKELIKKDPIQAARALSEPQRKVVVRGPAPKDVVGDRPQPYMPVPIRAGYDTLADSFGHLLYAKLKDGKVESPVSGRWADILWTGQPPYIQAGPHVLCVVSVHGNWAGFNAEELIALNAPRYWLPRAWNTGSWISHEDLSSKYETFKKETAS